MQHTQRVSCQRQGIADDFGEVAHGAGRAVVDRSPDGGYAGTGKQVSKRLSDGYCVSSWVMAGCLCGESCVECGVWNVDVCTVSGHGTYG